MPTAEECGGRKMIRSRFFLYVGSDRAKVFKRIKTSKLASAPHSSTSDARRSLDFGHTTPGSRPCCPLCMVAWARAGPWGVRGL